MPFRKVPAPLQQGTTAKSPNTFNGGNAIGGGQRRIRAPLRHSVDGAPATAANTATATATRQYFRSSYADPTVANGADPYVKSSARDPSGSGNGEKHGSYVTRPEMVQPTDSVRKIKSMNING